VGGDHGYQADQKCQGKRGRAEYGSGSGYGRGDGRGGRGGFAGGRHDPGSRKRRRGKTAQERVVAFAACAQRCLLLSLLSLSGA
jgi:hypothetical protein